MFQETMGSLNRPREEWKANMAEVASMAFSMDVKPKNKHTSLRRRRISKQGYSSHVLKTGDIYISFEDDEQER